jgi:uncharacterized protein
MILEGTVTNVTNFGAFVDIGVHQDGLVHISMLADHFVKDPHQVVKSGDLVKVKVLEVDLPRKRIALTMRLGEPAQPRAGEPGRERTERRERGAPRGQPPRQQDQSRRAGGDRRPAPQRQPAEQPVPAGGALAAAFEKARKG